MMIEQHWETENANLSLALTHDELIAGLQRLTEQIDRHETERGERRRGAEARLSTEERPPDHVFNGSAAELVALVEAIHRLKLRATIVVQPEHAHTGVAPISIEL